MIKSFFAISVSLLCGLSACGSAPDLYWGEVPGNTEAFTDGGIDQSQAAWIDGIPSEPQMLLVSEGPGKQLNYQQKIDRINAALELYDVICETRPACLYKLSIYNGKDHARFFKGSEQERNALVDLLNEKVRLLLVPENIYNKAHNQS